MIKRRPLKLLILALSVIFIAPMLFLLIQHLENPKESYFKDLIDL